MDCNTFYRLKNEVLICCIKLYFELEISISNMYDVECGISKEEIEKIEKLKDGLSVFINELLETL